MKGIKELGKIANDLSKIISKRGWFTKEEKKKLKEALNILNNILANKIKRSWEGVKK